jgi:mannose-1-phosphate guanylyltransferase
MRPLTETVPKPLIPLIDRPFLHHVLDHLDGHGVEEVLLSSPYLGEVFEGFVRTWTGAPRITWITEAQPLGTGGAIANAALHLDETFLVLNGDILTDLDLTALVAAHRSAGAVATITLTKVEDARPFGLVTTDGGGRVLAFREKPAEPVQGWVNAGTYVLEPDAIAGMPVDRAVSVEREVFPSLIERGQPVMGFASTAYWMDLGTPEKYLQATFDVLDGRLEGSSYPAPFVDPGATIDLRARLGRWVVVGPGAVVDAGAEVEDSVILAGARVKGEAVVRDSVIGPGAVVGSGARVEGIVTAEGERIPAAAPPVDGVRVGPGEPGGPA